MNVYFYVTIINIIQDKVSYSKIYIKQRYSSVKNYVCFVQWKCKRFEGHVIFYRRLPRFFCLFCCFIRENFTRTLRYQIRYHVQYRRNKKLNIYVQTLKTLCWMNISKTRNGTLLYLNIENFKYKHEQTWFTPIWVLGRHCFVWDAIHCFVWFHLI